jgi:hypothetical protein
MPAPSSWSKKAMKETPTRDDLSRRFRECVGRLSTSCALFDQGLTAEAKRIALAVREVVHDSADSESLLGRLGYKQQLLFAAQNAVYKPWNFLMLHGLVGLAPPGPGPRFVAHLDTLAPRLVPFEEWWGEPVLSNRARQKLHSRRHLILSLASPPDRGDFAPLLDENDERFASDFDLGLKASATSQRCDWTQNPLLPSARQIGHELLRTVAALDVLQPSPVGPLQSRTQPLPR